MRFAFTTAERPGLASMGFVGRTTKPCMPTFVPCSLRNSLIHPTRAALNDAGATVKKKRSAVKKDKYPPLPNPQERQQTVQRSFTLGGVGLHTGLYSFARVRPALAGEGRYFVAVPPGTNADDFRLETPPTVHHSALDIERGAGDGMDEDRRAQLFLEYLKEGDKGDFGDYVKRQAGDPADAFLMDWMAQGDPECATPRQHGESFVPASVSAAEPYKNAATLLRGTDFAVLSPESLLSALEACGVDNARIEIEGAAEGSAATGGGEPLEVPVVDGSALGWALEVQKAGLNDSMGQSGDPSAAEAAPRVAPAPQEMITVRDGDSFITFYPGPVPRVTAGVDMSEKAEVVGRQWFTWGPGDSKAEDGFMGHYRWQVAPARTVLPSMADVKAMLDAQMLRAGPDDCCLVAEGDSWYDPSLERFPGDEAARKAVADLLGNLALAAAPGGRGLPQGHVVAYRAGPALQLQFARALQAKGQEWAAAPVAL